MGNMLPVLLTLLEGLPADIAALQTAAANPAVAEFITLMEELFHVSPVTGGNATVIEPKSAK